MNYENFRKTLKQIKRHAGIVARGFSRTLYGALIAGLYGVSVIGFALVTIDDGYAAVFDFIAASATLAVAAFNTYVFGIKGSVKK